jgi:hypothetical protein
MPPVLIPVIRPGAPGRSLTPNALVLALSAAAGLTVVVFVAHAVLAMRGATYVGHVSGVWLGLARDFSDGVFYRPLLSDAGYGGTRYAPVLFVLVGALMRAGLTPLAAGFLVQILTAAALVAGVVALLRRCRLAWSDAGAAAALALAPYFVHETLFEIRADVLAATLEVWGLAFVAGRLEPGGRRHAMWPAAACFTLAWATKVTSLAGVAAAVAALWLSGERRAAGRLSLQLLMAAAVVLLVVHISSHGHALESFRACAFAESSVIETFRTMMSRGPTVLLRGSFVLTAAGVIALALFAGVFRQWRHPLSLFVMFSAVMTMFILSSPGTTLRNQIVELWIAVAVFVGFASRGRRVASAFGYSAVVVMLLLSARHVGAELVDADVWDAATRRREAGQEVIAAVDHFKGPVLSESAVLPVIAGHRPYLLDAFALRVVALSRPQIGADLDTKLARQYFKYVILLHDPASQAGSGFYRHVHFGWPIVARILEHYRWDRTIGPYRLYVPRTSSG